MFPYFSSSLTVENPSTSLTSGSDRGLATQNLVAVKELKISYNNMGFPKIRGTLFGGPNNKDHSILGSILGYPYFGKLPYGYVANNRASLLR